MVKSLKMKVGLSRTLEKYNMGMDQENIKFPNQKSHKNTLLRRNNKDIASIKKGITSPFDS